MSSGLRRQFRKRAIGLTLVVALVPVLAGAEPGKGPKRRHGPPPVDRILRENAERLGLDPEIEATIVDISHASRLEGERIREELHRAHAALRDALAADTPNEVAVMKLAEEIGALETESHKSRLRGMLQIRALLTPEQRQILVEIHNERRSRRERGRPHRGPREGRPGRGRPPPPNGY